MPKDDGAVIVNFLKVSLLTYLLKYIRGDTLCSELAENVQKVTLVGSFNFGSSWHPFRGFT